MMNDIGERIKNIEVKKALIEKNAQKHRDKLKEHEKEKEAAQEAKTILQVAAKETQKNIELHFSSLISKALHIVFNDTYIFKPEFIERRNKTECDFWLVNGENKLRPRFSVGGGVLDIISFASRISYWKLENKFKRTSPVIILDEPFRNLSRSLHPRAADTLKYISEKLGIQMIIVTHSPEIVDQADKVFHLEDGKIETI